VAFVEDEVRPVSACSPFSSGKREPAAADLPIRCPALAWRSSGANRLDGNFSNDQHGPATPMGGRIVDVLISNRKTQPVASWLGTLRPLRSRGDGECGSVAKDGLCAPALAPWCRRDCHRLRPTTTLKRCWWGSKAMVANLRGAVEGRILLAMSGPGWLMTFLIACAGPGTLAGIRINCMPAEHGWRGRKAVTSPAPTRPRSRARRPCGRQRTHTTPVIRAEEALFRGERPKVTVNQHGDYDRHLGKGGSPWSSLPETGMRTLLIYHGIPKTFWSLRKDPRARQSCKGVLRPGHGHRGGPCCPSTGVSSSLIRNVRRSPEGRVEAWAELGDHFPGFDRAEADMAVQMAKAKQRGLRCRWAGVRPAPPPMLLELDLADFKDPGTKANTLPLFIERSRGGNQGPLQLEGESPMSPARDSRFDPS